MLLLLLLVDALAPIASAPTQAMRETRLEAGPAKSHKSSSSGPSPSKAKRPQTSVGEPAVASAAEVAQAAEKISAVDLAEKDITKNVDADKVIIIDETTPEFDRQMEEKSGGKGVEPYLKKQRAQAPPQQQEIFVYVPKDPTTCVSITQSATDSWCKDNCAAGSCTQEICECDGGSANATDAANETEAEAAMAPEPEKPKTKTEISVTRQTFAQTAKDLGVPDEVAEALWTKLGDSLADPMIGVATATIIEPALDQEPPADQKVTKKPEPMAMDARTPDNAKAKKLPRQEEEEQQATLVSNVTNTSSQSPKPDEEDEEDEDEDEEAVSNSTHTIGTGAGYRGCFKDDVKTPDEAGRFYGPVVGRGLTLAGCQSKCIALDSNSTHFAVQHHMVCRCGSRPPDGHAPYLQVADSECDMNKGAGELCEGLGAPEKRGVGGTCGGKGVNSVYKILKSAKRSVKRAKKRAAKRAGDGL